MQEYNKHISFVLLSYKRKENYFLECLYEHSNSDAFTCIYSRYRAQYSKRTKQWRPVTILKTKEYKYIPALIAKVFEKHVKTGSVNRRIVRSSDDPRNIAENIAINPRPTIAHLIQTHQSRF
jgi:hypothetical protein